MSTEKYKKYTPIDLLKDDTFIRWQLFGNEEDSLFWKNLMEEYPDLKSTIGKAMILYKDNVRFNDFRLTQSEISKEFAALQNLIAEKKKRKAKYVLLRISAVAACIAAIAFLVPFLLNKKEGIQDITIFAQKTLPGTDLNSSDTRLILSENNTIALSSKESSIQYDDDAIKADENLILKENTASYNQLITPYGKRSSITFSDGTKVWVNAGSKLVYPTEFDKEKREIYVDGEIYIEVAEDKKRPFIVKTKSIDVSVLGTRFNVSAYENDKAKSVVLVSGSVSISSETQKKKTILQPNQMYSDIEGTCSVENVDAGMYTLWTQGLYQFESEKLKNILVRLERYYGIQIECDHSTAELKCSGKLDLKDNLDKLLTELSRALPIKCNKNTEGNYTIIKL